MTDSFIDVMQRSHIPFQNHCKFKTIIFDLRTFKLCFVLNLMTRKNEYKIHNLPKPWSVHHVTGDVSLSPID